MAIEFCTPDFHDREWIMDYYRRGGYRGCESSFVNLYLWGRDYGKIAQMGGFLLQFIKYGGVKFYAYPAGGGDLRPVIEALRRDARDYDHPMRLLGVTPERRAVLEELFPGKFQFIDRRNGYDYLYKIERLAELRGKKLQSKRNHCHRFEEEHPDWAVEPLTADNLPRCREMAARWFAQYDGETSEEHDFRVEKEALGKAFDHYGELGFEGLLLQSGGEVQAFTMGSRLTEDTFDVNFEKAFGRTQGAYPVINREFARYIRKKYPEIVYLNREDDMGLPGLRQAKLSYHPDILLEKAIAVWEEP